MQETDTLLTNQSFGQMDAENIRRGTPIELKGLIYFDFDVAQRGRLGYDGPSARNTRLGVRLQMNESE